MSEYKNFAELTFSNPFFLDLLNKYFPNSVLAEIVDTQGMLTLKLPVSDSIVLPKNCEDVIGFIYRIFEFNPDTPVGKVYAENKIQLMSDTVFGLSAILEGFTTVSIILETNKPSEENPDAVVNTRSEFTLKKTKNSNS